MRRLASLVAPALLALACVEPAPPPEAGTAPTSGEHGDADARESSGVGSPVDTRRSSGIGSDPEGPGVGSDQATTGSPDDDARAVGADTWTVAVARGAPVPGRTSARVAEVRFGGHAGHERMVVELEGAIPGWRALYVDHPVRGCDGEVVPLPGDAHLELTLQPAGMPTEGSRRWDPALDNLLEAALTCDREGRVSLVLGLSSPEPFRITTLQGPPRLVLDVRRPTRP